MKIKITPIIPMVMLLGMFVLVSAFAGAINYTYDNAGRLTKADYGSKKSTIYTYDSNGNLLTREVEVPVIQHTIAVSADPAAGGTVIGGGIYDEGAQVTVKAAANANYSFINWTQGGTEVSSAAEYTFTATADRTLVANFNSDWNANCFINSITN